MGNRRVTQQDFRNAILDHHRHEGKEVWVCVGCGDVLKDRKGVRLHHENKNKLDNRLDNIKVHCVTCSAREGGLGSAAKSKGGPYVCDDEETPPETAHRRRLMDEYDAGPATMKANFRLEPGWLAFIEKHLKETGSISSYDATIGASAWLDCSEETCRRFLRKYTHPDYGHLDRKLGKDGQTYIVKKEG